MMGDPYNSKLVIFYKDKDIYYELMPRKSRLETFRAKGTLVK